MPRGGGGRSSSPRGGGGRSPFSRGTSSFAQSPSRVNTPLTH